MYLASASVAVERNGTSFSAALKKNHGMSFRVAQTVDILKVMILFHLLTGNSPRHTSVIYGSQSCVINNHIFLKLTKLFMKRKWKPGRFFLIPRRWNIVLVVDRKRIPAGSCRKRVCPDPDEAPSIPRSLFLRARKKSYGRVTWPSVGTRHSWQMFSSCVTLQSPLCD